MKKISYKLLIILGFMAVLIPANYYFVRSNLTTLEYDAHAINQLGFISGSIQRYAKLKIQKHSNSIHKQINDAFMDLEKNYIPKNISNTHYQQEKFYTAYLQLQASWKNLQQAKGENFLHLSEQCWKEANRLTYIAQVIAEAKYSDFKQALFFKALFATFILLVAIIIVFKYVHNILEKEMIKDPLTQLYNRRYLFQRLNHAISVAQRQFSPLSMLMIDIDYFKKINDTFGHQKGDIVLKKVSYFILNNLREGDLAFRFGGEEFVVLTPNTDLEAAKKLAERLRNSIEKASILSNYSITISVGIASLEKEHNSATFIEAADKALYEAKHQGRNRVVCAKKA